MTSPKVHCSPVKAICARGVAIKAPLFVGTSLARRPRLDFLQAVAGAGIEVELVKAFQLLNTLERGRTERSFPVEGMQNNSLQQIAEGHVMVFGESLEHFEQTLLHPHPGLNALDHQLLILGHVYHCTTVHRT